MPLRALLERRLPADSLLQAGPGGQVFGGGETGHVHAYFGDDRGRGVLADPGDGDQQPDLRLERGAQPGRHDAGVLPDFPDLAFDVGEHLIEVIDTGQMQLHHLAVMVGEPAGQRQLQIGDLVAQHPAGQVCQHGGVAFPGYQRAQHRPPRYPEGV